MMGVLMLDRCCRLVRGGRIRSSSDPRRCIISAVYTRSISFRAWSTHRSDFVAFHVPEIETVSSKPGSRLARQRTSSCIPCF